MKLKEKQVMIYVIRLVSKLVATLETNPININFSVADVNLKPLYYKSQLLHHLHVNETFAF